MVNTHVVYLTRGGNANFRKQLIFCEYLSVQIRPLNRSNSTVGRVNDNLSF
jgi:hypothetical protein